MRRKLGPGVVPMHQAGAQEAGGLKSVVISAKATLGKDAPGLASRLGGGGLLVCADSLQLRGVHLAFPVGR